MTKLEVISIALIVLSILIFIGSIIVLKYKKIMQERALMYGIFGAITMQLFSIFVVNGNSTYYLILNALFLSMVFYNMVYLFAVRFAKIQDNKKNFLSYYVGVGVIGNVLSILMLGISSLMLINMKSNPETIKTIGQEAFDLLFNAYNYVLLDNLVVLFVSTLVAMFVTYVALTLFKISFVQKKFLLNLKAIVLLFAYYIVSLFSPTSAEQTTSQIVIFITLMLAGYWILKDSEVLEIENKDRPNPHGQL